MTSWTVHLEHSRVFPSFNSGSLKSTAAVHQHSLRHTMGLDYYKVLGVNKNASEDDLKKAYKKMVSEQ